MVENLFKDVHLIYPAKNPPYPRGLSSGRFTPWRDKTSAIPESGSLGIVEGEAEVSFWKWGWGSRLGMHIDWAMRLTLPMQETGSFLSEKWLLTKTQIMTLRGHQLTGPAPVHRNSDLHYKYEHTAKAHHTFERSL